MAMKQKIIFKSEKIVQELRLKQEQKFVKQN